MPAMYKLTFLPDGRTRSFAGSRGNYYRLANGTEITLHSDPIWCERCRTVGHGERIESIQAIDRQIADLKRLAAEIRRNQKSPPTPATDAPGDRHQQKQITDLMLRREWRAQRTSAPKCLNCGSTAILKLEHGKAVPIPEGMVRCEFVGLCSTNFNEWPFTPEGDRI